MMTGTKRAPALENEAKKTAEAPQADTIEQNIVTSNSDDQKRHSGEFTAVTHTFGDRTPGSWRRWSGASSIL